MERHELARVVEALLFATDQPVSVAAMSRAVDDDAVSRADVKAVVEILAESYEHQGRGFKILRVGNSYQVVTRERFAPWVDNLLRTRRKMRLSRAALETAAVIAYKQPISRIDVERIRGVDVGGVVNTLIERELITVKGRDPGPGRALLYATTQTFLEYFGLAKLSDLPQLDELIAAAGEERGGWTDDERARFEKFGVDLGSVPTPEQVKAFGDEDDALLDAPLPEGAAGPDDAPPAGDEDTLHAAHADAEESADPSEPAGTTPRNDA